MKNNEVELNKYQGSKTKKEIIVKEKVKKLLEDKKLSTDKNEPILKIIEHIDSPDKQVMVVEGDQGSGKSTVIKTAIEFSSKEKFHKRFMVSLWLILFPLFRLIGMRKFINEKLVKNKKPLIAEINMWVLFKDYKFTNENYTKNNREIDTYGIKTTIWKTIFLKLNIFKNIHSVFILGFELDGLDSKKKVASLNLIVFLLTFIPVLVLVPLVALYIRNKVEWPEAFLTPLSTALASLVTYQLMSVKIKRNSSDLYKDGFDIAIIKKILEKKSSRRKVIIHAFDLDRLDKAFWLPVLEEISIMYSSSNFNIILETTPDVVKHFENEVQNKDDKDRFKKIIPHQINIQSMNIDGLKSIFTENILMEGFKKLGYENGFTEDLYEALKSEVEASKKLSFRYRDDFTKNYDNFILNNIGLRTWDLIDEVQFRHFFSRSIVNGTSKEINKASAILFKNTNKKWDSEIFYHYSSVKNIMEAIENINNFDIKTIKSLKITNNEAKNYFSDALKRDDIDHKSIVAEILNNTMLVEGNKLSDALELIVNDHSGKIANYFDEIFDDFFKEIQPLDFLNLFIQFGEKEIVREKLLTSLLKSNNKILLEKLFFEEYDDTDDRARIKDICHFTLYSNIELKEYPKIYERAIKIIDPLRIKYEQLNKKAKEVYINISKNYSDYWQLIFRVIEWHINNGKSNEIKDIFNPLLPDVIFDTMNKIFSQKDRMKYLNFIFETINVTQRGFDRMTISNYLSENWNKLSKNDIKKIKTIPDWFIERNIVILETLELQTIDAIIKKCDHHYILEYFLESEILKKFSRNASSIKNNYENILDILIEAEKVEDLSEIRTKSSKISDRDYYRLIRNVTKLI